MFDKEYQFKGKHAEMVTRLTGPLNKEVGRGIFRYNYEIYALAPLVGYLYKRRSPIDKGEASTKIFRDKMMDEAENTKYNYRLLMLLQDKEKVDIDERVRIAFKMDASDEERAPYDEIYDEYVRGGVEVLYEHIIGDGKEVDDYIMNMFNFFEDFYNRYYAEIETLM